MRSTTLALLVLAASACSGAKTGSSSSGTTTGAASTTASTGASSTSASSASSSGSSGTQSGSSAATSSSSSATSSSSGSTSATSSSGSTSSTGSTSASSAASSTGAGSTGSTGSTSGSSSTGGSTGTPGTYFTEGFEVCPDGWTLTGDWECGFPYGIGSHTGSNALVTKLNYGPYSNNQSYAGTHADSPVINLAGATHPVVTFWTTYQTESGFDGFNIEVSTDQGATFTTLASVIPRYGQYQIQGQPAWSGGSLASWSEYRADLTPYAGQQIILRFGFASDGGYNYRGVSIDDLTVAEDTTPVLQILSTAAPDAVLNAAYRLPLQRQGGTSDAVWSVVSGGTNDTWLYIDSYYGTLAGTPTQAGPVSVTVRISEPSRPSNESEVTFTFTVLDPTSPRYVQDFEGTCPVGWTLTGLWQCRDLSPAPVYGAASGTQGLGLAPYADAMAWGSSTATSPALDLSGMVHPTFHAKRWLVTSDGDGAHLEVSTDGINFSLLTPVAPEYASTVEGQPGWSGDDSLTGWHDLSADLTAYAGQTVYLRFDFASDASTHYQGGLAIDDTLVVEH